MTSSPQTPKDLWDPNEILDDSLILSTTDKTDDEIAELLELREEEDFWDGLTIGGPVPPLFPKQKSNGILIVGKAPGTAEAAHGEPFTGPSGRLLDKILDRCNIVRNETTFTNAFRMQPAWTTNAEGKKTNNDVSLFFTPDISQGNARLPPFNNMFVKTGPDTHIRDLWKLARQMRPRLIIGLGKIAAWALTGEATIQGRTGMPLLNEPITLNHGNPPIFLTNHPAYALHKNSEAIGLQIAADIKDAYTYMLEQEAQATKEAEEAQKTNSNTPPASTQPI